MFNKNNFCHVASNNRNEQKAGIFVYKTTDNLQTISASGYFNDKIIDINLHDLIIHEQTNNADKTKVGYNILAVTERTLTNVGTTVIKRDWDVAIETAIAELQTYVDETFVRKDGTSVMTGPLKFTAGSMRGAIAGGLNGVTFFKMDSEGNLTQIGSLSDTQFVPGADNTLDIGTTVRKVERIYLGKVNNGYDIDVPVTSSSDTLALKSQVDDAANSGEQLYTTGVWYAKMYAATTVPTGAEYEGRNYADFSQVDQDNKPIIVVYTYTSGSWTQTASITPPKNHNGYMTITSKIWDIAEQSGQQGGLVLWSHNQETFTPYPKIISFENAALTGNSTTQMPVNPTNDTIINKAYLDAILAGIDTPELFDYKWKDCLTSRTTWALSDGNWIDDKADAYAQLLSDIGTIATVSVTAFVYQGTFVYAEKPCSVGDSVYKVDPIGAYASGTITSVNDNQIQVNGVWYTDMGTNPIVRAIEQTEIIDGITIPYCLASNGRKICHSNYETNVNNLYTATGVAWYYIIDTTNQQFKLPRVNPDKKKVLSSVEVITGATDQTWTGTREGMHLKQEDGSYSSTGYNLFINPNTGKIINGTGGTPSGTVAYTPANLYADIDNATTYYAGEQYLYFYVG